MNNDERQKALDRLPIRSEDYKRAKECGRTSLNRWEIGIPHHPLSIRLMKFLSEHDFRDYNDHFCWKTGGDGDNGETLMYEMDAFFETVPPQHLHIPLDKQ